MGYSQVHSSSASLVLYIQTGAVTPQYHLVHDDWFSTVSNMNSASLPPALWQQLLSTGYENNEYDKDAIADYWSASEPFAVREMDLGSTNTSEAAYDSGNVATGDGESLQSSEGGSIPDGDQFLRELLF